MVAADHVSPALPGPKGDELARVLHEVGETQLPDHILRVLISVCNRGRLQFSITVAQGGLLISGTAVGVAQFMHNLAEELEARPGIEAAVLAEPLRFLAELAVEPDDGPVPDDELPAFIHLEQASIRSGDTVVAENVRWRGRLVEVDGWFLGPLPTD